MYELNESKRSITIHDAPDLAWVQRATRGDLDHPILNYWHITPDYIEAADCFRLHRLNIPCAGRAEMILKVNLNKHGLPMPLKDKSATYPCQVWTDTTPFPATQYLIDCNTQYVQSITVNRAQLAWALSMDSKKVDWQQVTTLEANRERLYVTYNGVTVHIAAPGAVKDVPHIVVGINRWFLMDALSRNQPDVLIHFTAGHSPIIVESPCQTWRAWIMPMQLNHTQKG